MTSLCPANGRPIVNFWISKIFSKIFLTTFFNIPKTHMPPGQKPDKLVLLNYQENNIPKHHKYEHKLCRKWLHSAQPMEGPLPGSQPVWSKSLDTFQSPISHLTSHFSSDISFFISLLISHLISHISSTHWFANELFQSFSISPVWNVNSSLSGDLKKPDVKDGLSRKVFRLFLQATSLTMPLVLLLPRRHGRYCADFQFSLWIRIIQSNPICKHS